jgi:hypothetical protein
VTAVDVGASLEAIDPFLPARDFGGIVQRFEAAAACSVFFFSGTGQIRPKSWFILGRWPPKPLQVNRIGTTNDHRTPPGH